MCLSPPLSILITSDWIKLSKPARQFSKPVGPPDDVLVMDLMRAFVSFSSLDDLMMT